MRLVIVESPNKTKKIAGFLGPDYRVMASFGHIRDLPEGELGIAFKDGAIIPSYQPTVKGQRSPIAALRQAAAQAEEVFLATDPDREGEAISWHLAQVLGRNRYRRVAFHAITKQDVLAALAAPRDIDQHLVDAQQSRRVLDRVVGWAVSPTCKTIGDPKARSAGRVQSVALRLVAEREREIGTFKAVSYQVLEAQVRAQEGVAFWGRLVRWQEHVIKQGIADKAVAETIRQACEKGPWVVVGCSTAERRRSPPPPFTTATAQQALSISLGLNPEASMKVLQALFEEGHITYHRTDSTALSPEALDQARSWIAGHLPADYLPAEPVVHATKAANAQEAHEAIRPTHPETGPDAVGGEGGEVYRIIWSRFIASQMTTATDAVTTVDFDSADHQAGFRAKGVRPTHDGWRRLTRDATEEPTDEGREAQELPPLDRQDPLACQELRMRGSTTKPPPRYTQASLVKKLDGDGIGRPSTYAAILKTLFARGYVIEQKRKLAATSTGLALIDFLVKAYSGNFIEYAYTATMEGTLDKIARGETPWEAAVTSACRDLVALAQRHGLEYDILAGESRATQVYPPPNQTVACKKCGDDIGFLQGPAGWILLNPDGTRHACKSRRKAS